MQDCDHANKHRPGVVPSALDEIFLADLRICKTNLKIKFPLSTASPLTNLVQIQQGPVGFLKNYMNELNCVQHKHKKKIEAPSILMPYTMLWI